MSDSVFGVLKGCGVCRFLNRHQNFTISGLKF